MLRSHECPRQVEWGERIACFMPNKRLSSKLISTLNATYLSGEGGYNEVAVPTINSVMGGSFGTASEVSPPEGSFYTTCECSDCH